jgi:hypothetical protein
MDAQDSTCAYMHQMIVYIGYVPLNKNILFCSVTSLQEIVQPPRVLSPYVILHATKTPSLHVLPIPAEHVLGIITR